MERYKNLAHLWEAQYIHIFLEEKMEAIKLHQFREKLELLGYSKRVVKDYPNYVKN